MEPVMDHNIEASVGEAQESITSSLKRRKKRSEAWDFYEKLPPDMNEDNRLRAKCKTCGLVFLADSTSGTSHLNRHHLKHKKEASNKGSYYPTANVYFHKIWKIHMMIIEEKHGEDLNIKTMATEMKTKFQKYWQEDYSPIASMAVVLDPRYKLKLVKFCFTKLDPLTCNEKVKVIEDNMHALFKEYLKSSIIDVDMVESSRGRGDVEMVDEMVDDMEEYDIFESQSELGLEKTQLNLYLEEPVLTRKGNEDLDVLKFWRDNRIKYPELSLMARDLLSIPITTVASESAFSIGGRVIGKYQSSILPENAEAKLCSRDWLYGHQASGDSEEEDDIAIDVDKIASKIFN